MEYVLILLLISLTGLIIYGQKRKKKNYQERVKNFLEMNISTKLLLNGFRTTDDNSITGNIKTYEVGIYFLAEEKELKLFGSIELKSKFNSTKEIMSFNKSHSEERFIVDMKTGFRKEIDKSISFENLLIEFDKMIEVALELDKKNEP